MGPHFAQVGARFPGLRLALIPIGAYRPEWFMAPVHVGPLESIAAHDELGVQTSIAIHWGTFSLGIDGMNEAADIIRASRATRDFRVLDHGIGADLSAVVAQRTRAVS